MAIQSSGAVSFSDLATEFGDTTPYSMSEYIRAGSLVPQADANNNIPTTAATMRLSHFYGAVNVIAQTATSGTNVSLATVFGSNWTTDVPKEYIIPSGVTLGATSTSAFALTVESNLVGTLTIKNSGSIEGAGGAAGAAGGDAIDANATCTVINNSGGTIYGGGGGGGAGGNGTTTSTQSLGGGQNNNNSGNHGTRCTYSCTDAYGGGAYCGSCTAVSDETSRCNACYRNTTVSTSGGSGGVGQGYNQSATSGAAGGTNAGTGGTGGSFGNAGATGSNGTSTNGSAGGAAGNYINGISNVTLTNNGTVAGGTV